MQKILGFLIIIVFLPPFISHTLAQEGLQPEHLFEIKQVNQVAVSEDGNYIAYTLIVPRCLSEGIGYDSRELHVFDLKNNTNVPIKTGNVNISSLTWMPGKNKICFRHNAPNTNGAQIFCIYIKDKNEKQLTDFDRPVRSYEFKNNNEILFTSLQTLSPERQNLNDAGIDIKIFEEELRHIELHSYNIEKQTKSTLITDLTVYDFTVSPDGSRIAAAISPKNHIDYQYMFKRIHIIDSETGEILNVLDNPGKLANMRWSPDGKRLAFRASSDLHDSVEGSLFVMNPEDESQSFSELTNLVKNLELSVIDFFWEDNNTLLFAAEESVDISLSRINLSEGNTREIVIPGGEIVFRRFFKHDNNLFFAGNTNKCPNELIQYDYKGAQLKKLTNHNKWLEEIKLAKQEKIEYYARDTQDIHGVLIYPLNYRPNKKYPMIVYIHGGPEASVQNGWTSRYATWGQFAAARDYFVFFPNYRASSGRGVDFTMAGFGDLLGTEYEDVLDGIDFLIQSGKVDPERVGIGGGSYGGFFAAYSATKHSDRFAASVVFVGIGNQVSKRKTTDIPYEDYYVHWGFWTHENHDKVWAASPVKYAHKSNTPTLILHGEEDTRVPVSQGMELYRALKLHGNAPVRFILYPGEGHGNAKNINRYDYLIRTLEWFDFYLIDNPGSKNMPEKYLNYGIH